MKSALMLATNSLLSGDSRPAAYQPAVYVPTASSPIILRMPSSLPHPRTVREIEHQRHKNSQQLDPVLTTRGIFGDQHGGRRPYIALYWRVRCSSWLAPPCLLQLGLPSKCTNAGHGSCNHDQVCPMFNHPKPGVSRNF